MDSPDAPSSPSRPKRHATLIRVAAAIASVLLIAAWCFSAFRPVPSWPTPVLSSLAALLVGPAYAFHLRPQKGRLLTFGKKQVQVRSLDEWTLYHYGVLFEQASTQQQQEALSHYRVGLRLFPARPQDLLAKQGPLPWLLSLLTFCCFFTVSEAVHGWGRFVLFAAGYGWLWLCLRMAKRFPDTPAASSLTELRLS